MRPSPGLGNVSGMRSPAGQHIKVYRPPQLARNTISQLAYFGKNRFNALIAEPSGLQAPLAATPDEVLYSGKPGSLK